MPAPKLSPDQIAEVSKLVAGKKHRLSGRYTSCAEEAVNRRLVNYTFLTSEIAVARPNVYAGSKEAVSWRDF